MPTLESIEYDRFSIDDPEQKPLTLEEATKKADVLRKSDLKNFYRVEVADEASATFKVKKVEVSSAYADFMARMMSLLGKRSFRLKQR